MLEGSEYSGKDDKDLQHDKVDLSHFNTTVSGVAEKHKRHTISLRSIISERGWMDMSHFNTTPTIFGLSTLKLL